MAQIAEQQVCTSAEASQLLVTLREVYRRGDEAEEAARLVLQSLVGEQGVAAYEL